MERGAGARLLLLLWAACCWHARAVGSSRYTIGVTNGGPWGDWAWPEMCPDGLFTIGFSIKVEAPQGISGDDTAMNGIRLHCSRGRTVESESGRWGAWSEPQWCPRGGFLVAFSLRVEAPKTLGDNTGANNVRFRCSDGTELEGPGLAWGDFGKWSEACPKGICGAQTKVQASRGLLDDTALNDVRFFCCSS
ncbi:vitelline membrane outer layer protein 1 homolog isoform X1 [Pipistrellus kuhlii]|uniref:Vitelline membrane outer layer 1-like protein n=1 Tax=Pipistrellus kuhlii TaxID=59472 RepID=A0A7J7TYE4_PIPKU|nr:vitelline membrane outer layer protein 1 homolog isoform X1 [Pipistrellus kuhlii]KAF6305594.1 vitelline membrane outer layer 1-like protein [Pipistrellus kuhlii]